MINSRISTGLLALAALASLGGCAQTSRAPVYTGATGTAVAVPVGQQRGRVISVRDVTISSTTARAPRTTGGTLSTAARILNGSVTAVADVVGDAIDSSKGGGRPGEEITIELSDGSIVSIVQERSDPPLAPDERVLIVKTTSPAGIQRGDKVVRDDTYVPSSATRRSRFGNFTP